jgi:hypothetical protein
MSDDFFRSLQHKEKPVRTEPVEVPFDWCQGFDLPLVLSLSKGQPERVGWCRGTGNLNQEARKVNRMRKPTGAIARFSFSRAGMPSAVSTI